MFNSIRIVQIGLCGLVVLSGKPEFKEIADKALECLKNLALEFEELHVYPVSRGYRLEVYGRFDVNVATRLRDCIAEKTGFEVSLRLVDENVIKFMARKSIES